MLSSYPVLLQRQVTHPFILSTYTQSASYPISAFLDFGDKALNKMDKNALVGKERQLTSYIIKINMLVICAIENIGKQTFTLGVGVVKWGSIFH